MNDLLGDSGYNEEDANKYGEADLEAQEQPEDPNMQEFFGQVDDIKRGLTKIKGKIAQLQDAQEETKLVTRAAAMKDIKRRMDSYMGEIRKIALGIKNSLQALDKANAQSRGRPGCEEGSSTDRTRMSVTTALKKKLRDITTEFQELNGKFSDEYRETVERRVYTVTGKRLDEDTVDHLIETGESESIFQKAIQEQGRGQLLDTMAEISERHAAVKDIEKQLLELHQLFMDMAVLVEAQQEYVDTIETNVDVAITEVQEGTKTLVVAKKIQSNTRKWYCIGILIVIVIIAVVVVVVIKPWQK